MRYIKKYEGFFDPAQALVSIGKEFSESRISDLLAEEREEWSDNYGDVGNGEAEEQVIERMISWYESNHKTRLDDAQKSALTDAIKEHFKLLS